MNACTQFRSECHISGAGGSEDCETPTQVLKTKSGSPLRAICILLTMEASLQLITLVYIKKISSCHTFHQYVNSGKVLQLKSVHSSNVA